MRKAAAIVFVSMMTVLILTIILVTVNPVNLQDALFEVFSACGTVGLTRALTPGLGTAGRITIIIAMYLGRIGPISLAALFSGNDSDSNKVRYSEGVFYVG